MNSSNSRNIENNKAIPTCFGRSRNCVLHSLILAVSTVVFIISMTLTVYGTQKASKDHVIVILIVAACVLYLSNFIGNLYPIYYSKSNHRTVRNIGNSYAVNQATRSFAETSFTSGRLPDSVNFLNANQLVRTTPPPPYEIQMNEMSRMLFPGTSEIPNLSTRDSEIMEEARKLLSRLYEEIKKNDQHVVQSPRRERSIQHVVQSPRRERSIQHVVQSPRNDRSIQHVVQLPRNERSIQHSLQMPETRARQQERIIPKVSHPNLVVNLQETGVKSVHDCRPLPVDFFPKRFFQQKGTGNLIAAQPSSQRLVIGCESPLQPSVRRQDSLHVARKRKLHPRSKEIQTRSTKEQSAQVVIGKNDKQYHTYEPIEGTSSTQSAHNLVRYRVGSSEQSSPVYSAASEPPATGRRRRRFRNPTVKVRRTLSAPTSRRFHQLGQSPETVLDAIATNFELTPDEWMAAWTLGNKGVSPNDRAKILGVDLQENSSNDSN